MGAGPFIRRHWGAGRDVNISDVCLIRGGVCLAPEYATFDWLWWFVPLVALVIALGWYTLRREQAGVLHRVGPAVIAAMAGGVLLAFGMDALGAPDWLVGVAGMAFEILCVGVGYLIVRRG
jgi:hypothetical protein